MIFSIAMGADYSFYMKTIETHARAFIKVVIFSIGSVTTVKYTKGYCRLLPANIVLSEIF